MLKIIKRATANRYIRRFGGRIALLTFLAADGLYHTLYDKHDNRIALISD